MLTLLCWIIAFALADAAWKARDDRRAAAKYAALATLAVLASVAILPNLLYLGKVAGRLAMPTGLFWLGLLGITGWLWVRREVKRVLLAAAFCLVFTVLGNASLGAILLAGLESDYVANSGLDGEPLEVVFVLGGSTSLASGSDLPRLGDSGDRLLTAARAYRGRRVQVLVTSGSSIAGIGRMRDVADEAAQILVDMGVPESAILEIPEPKNSSQEVARYAELAQERGWTRIGIVTSAWHMRRVQKLCERAGLKAEPIPADFRGDIGWDGLLSVIPDANGFRNLQRASWEILGAAVGR